jgi:hypothetical protein
MKQVAVAVEDAPPAKDDKLMNVNHSSDDTRVVDCGMCDLSDDLRLGATFLWIQKRFLNSITAHTQHSTLRCARKATQLMPNRVGMRSVHCMRDHHSWSSEFLIEPVHVKELMISGKQTPPDT